MIGNDKAIHGKGEEQAMHARTCVLPLVVVPLVLAALALPLGAERAKAKVDCTAASRTTAGR